MGPMIFLPSSADDPLGIDKEEAPWADLFHERPETPALCKKELSVKNQLLSVGSADVSPVTSGFMATRGHEGHPLFALGCPGLLWLRPLVCFITDSHQVLG